MRSQLAHLAVRLYGLLHKLGITSIPGFRACFLFFYELYKRMIEDTLSDLLKRHPEVLGEGHVLDVGANVGYTTNLLLQHIRPGFDVYAFEPEERALGDLKCRLKEKYKNLHAVHAAVGERDGIIEFEIDEIHPADHRVASSGSKKNGEIRSVDLVSLDSFLQKENRKTPIAFLKIDVQGFEPAVIRGARQTLEQNRNITVYVEFDPFLIKAFDEDPMELLSTLRNMGFELLRVQRGGSLKTFSDRECEELEKSKHYVDLLAVRNPPPHPSN